MKMTEQIARAGKCRPNRLKVNMWISTTVT